MRLMISAPATTAARRPVYSARFAGLGIAAVAVIAMLVLSPNFRWRTGPEITPYAGDFIQEWVGGYVVRAGDRQRLYDGPYTMALQHDAQVMGFEFRPDLYIPIVYPPFYYLLVSPLAALPFRAAAHVWVALILVWFGLSATLLRSMLITPVTGPVVESDETTERRWRLFALLALPAAVGFAPFAENLVSAQKATLVLLLFTATLLLLERGKPFAAGLVFGLQAFKPQLAVIVPLAMLFMGQWRFVAGVGCTVLVLLGISLGVGLDACREYFVLMSGAADYIRAQPDYLHRLHGLYAFFTLMAGGPTFLARAGALIGMAVVVWSLAGLLRRPIEPGSERFRLQFAGLTVATPLLSPHLLTYDLTLLLLPLSLVAFALLRGTLPPERRQLVLWLTVGLYLACGLGPPLARQTGVQLTTPLMLGLLLALKAAATAMRQPGDALREQSS